MLLQMKISHISISLFLAIHQFSNLFLRKYTSRISIYFILFYFVSKQQQPHKHFQGNGSSNVRESGVEREGWKIVWKSNVAKKIYETYFKIKWKKTDDDVEYCTIAAALFSTSFCNFCKMLYQMCA